MAGVLQSKLSSALRHARDVPRALNLAWDAAPGWTAASAALLVAQGLLPLATVWLSRSLVDATVAAIRTGAGWRNAHAAIVTAILIAAVALAGEILRSLAGWVRTNQGELVQDHILDLVHRKSVDVDLAFYDSPEFFDRLHRARAEAWYRPLALIESAGSLARNAVTLVTMFALLFSFGPWMPLALAAGTAPALWVVLRYAVRQHGMRLSTTEPERRAWYYDWLLTSRESAAELRLFGLGDRFRTAFNGVRGDLRRKQIALARDNAAAELLAGTSALAVTGVTLGWMFSRALSGLVSLGNLTLFYQALQQGLRVIRSVLDNVGQLYYNSLFVNNLFEFLALEPTLAEPEQPHRVPDRLQHGITFENVTFRYPGAGRPALRNFSLQIPAGGMVAFVGPNGSGKTTLAKLLCRFYDPVAGRITFDGVDLRSFSLEQLRARIAVLFQDPVRHNATAAESIALGDQIFPAAAARIRSAAEAAGADDVISGLPLGFETLLGKAFLDGEELSGGQWQRIALARAFYRQADVLILDEPTSAMDPWAEADWMDRFRATAVGFTSLLITHRLTTAMRADLICVIADGEIVESGSHDRLIAQRGLYAQSWERQTESNGLVRA